MYEIYERLLKARNVKSIDVSKATGISTGTLTDWKKGRYIPKADKRKKIADYFGVSLAFLDGESENADTNSDFVKIPILGRVAAGIPLYAQENILGYEDLPRKIADLGEYFCLYIKGRSMEPKMFEDDIIVVQKQSDVECGEIAIVLVNGEDATVKKIQKRDDGIMLVGYNLEVYPPHFYSRKQVRELPVEIIGKVIEMRRKF